MFAILRLGAVNDMKLYYASPTRLPNFLLFECLMLLASGGVGDYKKFKSSFHEKGEDVQQVKCPIHDIELDSDGYCSCCFADQESAENF